jgi:hypothetical protein
MPTIRNSRDLANHVEDPERADDDGEDRAVLEPLTRCLCFSDVLRRRLIGDAHLGHSAGVGVGRRRVVAQRHRHDDQRGGNDHALPESERLTERDDAADLFDGIGQ